ncbi:ketopantoate reductase C-terminal domain-containing protein [Bradyrhizobium sp. Ash2021]|uniref:ketopantoate reductase C-terminal domain-containing protein n=1 Tax=Bradyrhizobium sp. Ash2021 TaxID=2954771 RepID=UPI0035C1BAD8
MRQISWRLSSGTTGHSSTSAIAQLPGGRLVKGEGTTAVMRDLVDECVAVAKADGVTIPGDVDVAV